MGFLFYITDFWYWRWKALFESARIYLLDRNALRSYYVNFFFMIAYFSASRRLSQFIEALE
jgi:hypothetical protein